MERRLVASIVEGEVEQRADLASAGGLVSGLCSPDEEVIGAECHALDIDGHAAAGEASWVQATGRSESQVHAVAAEKIILP